MGLRAGHHLKSEVIGLRSFINWGQVAWDYGMGHLWLEDKELCPTLHGVGWQNIGDELPPELANKTTG